MLDKWKQCWPRSEPRRTYKNYFQGENSVMELDNEWSEREEFLKTGEEGEIFKEGIVYSVESNAENC